MTVKSLSRHFSSFHVDISEKKILWKMNVKYDYLSAAVVHLIMDCSNKYLAMRSVFFVLQEKVNI